jgi:hypothetical protein
MKLLLKTMILIVFVLSFQNLFSQTISLGELIRLNNINEDDFDTFVIAKGFKYDGYENGKDYTAKRYTFYENGYKSSFITKYKYNYDNKEMVSFQTPHSETYMNIKTSAKNQGFKYVNSTTIEKDNVTLMNYYKGRLNLTLASGKDESNYGGQKTLYEISIIENK